MKFGEAISSVFRNYVNFKGRARRSEYWYFYLFNILINITFSILSAVITQLGLNFAELTRICLGLTYLVSFLSSIYSLAALLPGIAVTVRRLHDIGKSGWNYLLPLIPLALTVVFSIIPFIIMFVLNRSYDHFDDYYQLTVVIAIIFSCLVILSLIAAIVFTIILIVWMCRDSEPGENEWGPNPKEITTND